MQFFQWRLTGEEQSPHFGSVGYSRKLIDAGVTYPETSFAEDFGFVVRAMDQGFSHVTLDNSDGTFTYVRHRSQNTWQIPDEQESAMADTMEPIDTPAWVSPRVLQFYTSLPATPEVTKPHTNTHTHTPARH